MNALIFKQWMEQGAAMDKKSFAQLDQFVKKYPYCQSARIIRALYLFKNTSNSGKEVQLTSIYTNNRIKLHQLLQKNVEKREVIAIETKAPIVSKDLSKEKPIESKIIKEVKEEEKPKVIVNEAKTIVATVVEPDKIKENVAELERKPKISVTEEKDKQTLLREEIEKRLAEISKEQQKTQPQANGSHNELIDKFILTEPKLSPPKKDATAELPDLSEKSAADNINLVSETLADIHFNQGNYEKALQIYENLILNNPEKSSYFAAQIEKINQLLNKK